MWSRKNLFLCLCVGVKKTTRLQAANTGTWCCGERKSRGGHRNERGRSGPGHTTLTSDQRRRKFLFYSQNSADLLVLMSGDKVFTDVLMNQQADTKVLFNFQASLSVRWVATSPQSIFSPLTKRIRGFSHTMMKIRRCQFIYIKQKMCRPSLFGREESEVAEPGVRWSVGPVVQ